MGYVPAMNNVPRVALVAALAISLPSCAEPPHPRTPDSGHANSASPIARSTVLITNPGDDTELLGRVLPSGPDPGTWPRARNAIADSPLTATL